MIAPILGRATAAAHTLSAMPVAYAASAWCLRALMVMMALMMVMAPMAPLA